ncbi:hypothetical protein B0H13DRAFT_1926134 [Mycena leptocephala]|nr:hypothetical protein B0H13DRAFT_1926134 [Mycena leptocephala]
MATNCLDRLPEYSMGPELPKTITLVVGSISSGISDATLKELLIAYGPIKSFTRGITPACNPRAFAITEFEEPDAVLHALRLLHNVEPPALEAGCSNKHLLIKVDEKTCTLLDAYEVRRTLKTSATLIVRRAVDVNAWAVGVQSKLLSGIFPTSPNLDGNDPHGGWDTDVIMYSTKWCIGKVLRRHGQASRALRLEVKYTLHFESRSLLPTSKSFGAVSRDYAITDESIKYLESMNQWTVVDHLNWWPNDFNAEAIRTGAFEQKIRGTCGVPERCVLVLQNLKENVKGKIEQIICPRRTATENKSSTDGIPQFHCIVAWEVWRHSIAKCGVPIRDPSTPFETRGP